MKLPIFKSLRFRLPFLILLGVVPTTVIAIALASYNANKIIRQDTRENLALKAQSFDDNVTRWTNMNVLALENLTQQPGVRSLDPQQQQAILATIPDTYEYIYLAHIVDLDGLNIARSDGKPAKNYSDRLWLKEIKAGSEIFLQTLIGKTNQKPALCMAAPIRQQTALSAVATMCSDLEELTLQVGAAKFGDTGYGFIINEQGRILGHPDPNLTSGEELTDYSNYPPVANLLAGEEGYFTFTDEDGTEWLSHANRLDNGWGVFILQQKSEAFIQARQFQQIATAIAGIAILAVGAIAWLLASRLTKPISEVTEAATGLAQGNLDQTVDVDREDEIGILADSFNTMARQLKESISTIETKAEEQRQQRERLETEIAKLLEEVSDATEGDLTVRASLSSLELATVADLFNAIIDNLRQIAIEAKQSTGQVGSSLKQSEEAIRALAEQAITEATETRNTLLSIEQMSRSIEEVAENASQAAAIADDTNNTVLESSNAMDRTVDSILSLRTTVSDTAKKMKRLSDSSQKITQVVTLIEEIALKTNLLAINAGNEASRAGEQGQGFTVIAEQVGALAEQSVAATKEIAQIVTDIQLETQEVAEAMETGTTQVVDTTRMVESTKESLAAVLSKSQEINQLMRSIAQATVSQSNTSQTVTNLMQQIAQLSEASSLSSQQVAESMMTTAQVAQKLETSVAKFKVATAS